MKCLFELIACFLSFAVSCQHFKWNPLYKNTPHISALILARGGSKSIPLKNIALVGGRTLLSRSLSTISKVPNFSSVWVATDHYLIAEHAIRGGANIHWSVAENVKDTSTSIAAVQHFLTIHTEIDYVALIQCTSPFIKAKYLRQAISYISSGAECVFSVTRSHKLRWKHLGNNIFPQNFDPKHRPRRQDVKEEYVENGMIYFSSRKLLEQGLFQSQKQPGKAYNAPGALGVHSMIPPVQTIAPDGIPSLENSNRSNIRDVISTVTGSIPPIYREVFDICSYNGEPIHKDVYQKLLAQCKLDNAILQSIWELAGPPQGPITRTNLYKTLALVAWSQQGKSPSNKLFETFNGKEYPIPELGDLNSVRNLKQQVNAKQNPAVLGLSYLDITQLDTINVELVPEKKGIFLKHSEYVVSSRRLNSKVTRRYNDFVALYDLLLSRFPYRIIPRLPPKKIVSDAHFLESRRRGLYRWLTLICRHPAIHNDALLAFFLTDQGPDIQYRIRDIFRRAPDEFMTSDFAANAKELLPSDCSEFAANREQVRSLVHIVAKMKVLADSDVERGQCYSRDTEELATQLKALGSINIGQICSANWSQMQKGFSAISRDLSSLSNRAQQQANLEQITVCERLGLLLDVLTAHRDLCERLEKGLAHDHQTALAKMLSLKKRKIQGVIRGTDTESVEQLEAKMLTQESVISNMELRSDFSLFCVHMETQLIYAYLDTLSSILNSLVSLKIRSHTELAEIWKQVVPTANKYLPVEYSSQNGSTS